MLRMLLRRMFLGATTVVIVSMIIFAGVEMLPGDACTAFLEREAQGKLLENLPARRFWNAKRRANCLKIAARHRV